MINVTLKGGAVKEFEPGVSPADVAKSIGMGLYKAPAPPGWTARPWTCALLWKRTASWRS